MGLSRALATIAASISILALLAMAWSAGPRVRILDPSSPQLVELLEELPKKLPPPDLAPVLATPRARVDVARLFHDVGLGPRNAHPVLLLRPPRG